jgi:hypothetical protein
VSKMRMAIEIRTSALGACQRDVLPGQRVFLGVESFIVDAFRASRRVPRPQNDKNYQGDDQRLSPPFRSRETVTDHRDHGREDVRLTLREVRGVELRSTS